MESETRVNAFYTYVYYALVIGLLVFSARIITAIFAATIFGIDWSAKFVSGFLPLFSFDKTNLVLFELVNLVSLLFSVLALFVVFLVAFASKATVEDKKFGIFWDVTYIALFLFEIQLFVELSAVKVTLLRSNWWTVTPLIMMLLIATVAFLLKKNQVLSPIVKPENAVRPKSKKVVVKKSTNKPPQKAAKTPKKAQKVADLKVEAVKPKAKKAKTTKKAVNKKQKS